jgi:hypothetical protein
MKKSVRGTFKTCSRGHEFYKSSDCPVCPKCWSGFYRKKVESDFPKISAPALRALSNVGIKKLADLKKYTAEELLDLHGMGPKALEILKAALAQCGIGFKPDKKKTTTR